jgi:hypothetical protein
MISSNICCKIARTSGTIVSHWLSVVSPPGDGTKVKIRPKRFPGPGNRQHRASAHPMAHSRDRQFYTADVFMHTWGLARATGQDDRLDSDFCAKLPGWSCSRGSCARPYNMAPGCPVKDDADAQTKMLAFIGRDPYWTPPR